MRRYERDSAEAATRVVVMAMLADGHLSRCEIEAFAHADAHLADGEATVLAEMFAQWGIDARAKHAATPAAQNLSMPARKENRHAQLQH